MTPWIWDDGRLETVGWKIKATSRYSLATEQFLYISETVPLASGIKATLSPQVKAPLWRRGAETENWTKAPLLHPAVHQTPKGTYRLMMATCLKQVYNYKKSPLRSGTRHLSKKIENGVLLFLKILLIKQERRCVKLTGGHNEGFSQSRTRMDWYYYSF